MTKRKPAATGPASRKLTARVECRIEKSFRVDQVGGLMDLPPAERAAETTKESSPIARGGAGQTALNRLFYQLGWTKGRTDEACGLLGAGPETAELKTELMRLAEKYDAQP